jgi:hypothetical protein
LHYLLLQYHVFWAFFLARRLRFEKPLFNPSRFPIGFHEQRSHFVNSLRRRIEFPGWPVSFSQIG